MSEQLSAGFRVTVEDFLHAAPVFQQSGNELNSLTEAIGQDLGALGSFWGGDPSGLAFADTYLKAQASIFVRLGLCAGVVSGVGDGLQQMAANYGITEVTNLGIVQAEMQSGASQVASILTQRVRRPNVSPLTFPSVGTGPLPRPDPEAQAPPTAMPTATRTPAPRPRLTIRPRPDPSPTPDPRPQSPPTPPPPSVGELVYEGPSGIVGKLLWKLGIPWPMANTGNLRDAGDEWTRLSEGILDIIAAANREASSIAANNQGQAVDAFEAYWQKYGGGSGDLTKLSDSCHAVALACYRYADAVDEARHQIEEIGIEAGVVFAATLVAAFFTFGASEDAAAGMASYLLAAAQAVADALEADVPAIVEDMIATASAFGSFAIAGFLTGSSGQLAQDLVRMAFGESTAPLGAQVSAGIEGALLGEIGEPLSDIGEAGAAGAAARLTQLSNAIASGEIKVADPTVAQSIVRLAELLEGPAGKAGVQLSASALAQLAVNNKISVEDLTSDYLSSNLIDASKESE
jgi:uncharacterized protein YukE